MLKIWTPTIVLFTRAGTNISQFIPLIILPLRVIEFFLICWLNILMNFIKLQIGCLVIAVYLELIYIWQTTGKNAKVSCNPIFDVLMMIIPSLIVFDGVTAWTVNHLEIVPVSLNLFLHAVFFILLTAYMLVMFLHTLSFIKGFPKKLLFRILIFLPFIVSVILIIAFLPELEFVIGKKVNYSMGISVVVCYIVLLFYFILIFVFTIRRIKYLEMQLAYKNQEIEFLKKIVSLDPEAPE